LVNVGRSWFGLVVAIIFFGAPVAVLRLLVAVIHISQVLVSHLVKKNANRDIVPGITNALSLKSKSRSHQFPKLSIAQPLGVSENVCKEGNSLPFRLFSHADAPSRLESMCKLPKLK